MAQGKGSAVVLGPRFSCLGKEGFVQNSLFQKHQATAEDRLVSSLNLKKYAVRPDLVCS